MEVKRPAPGIHIPLWIRVKMCNFYGNRQKTQCHKNLHFCDTVTFRISPPLASFQKKQLLFQPQNSVFTTKCGSFLLFRLVNISSFILNRGPSTFLLEQKHSGSIPRKNVSLTTFYAGWRCDSYLFALRRMLIRIAINIYSRWDSYWMALRRMLIRVAIPTSSHANPYQMRLSERALGQPFCMNRRSDGCMTVFHGACFTLQPLFFVRQIRVPLLTVPTFAIFQVVRFFRV